MQSKRDFWWWSLSSVFLFFPPPACSLFGLFLAMNMQGLAHGVYSADPSHRAPGDFGLGISSIFPALPPKGCKGEETPLTTPLPVTGLKKCRSLHFYLPKMSSFASYGEKVLSLLPLPQVWGLLRAFWKQADG